MVTIYSHYYVAALAVACALISLIDIICSVHNLPKRYDRGWLGFVLVAFLASGLHLSGWGLWLYTNVEQSQFGDIRDILGFTAPFCAILMNILVIVMSMTMLHPKMDEALAFPVGQSRV